MNICGTVVLKGGKGLLFSFCGTISCVLGFHSADPLEMNPSAAIWPEPA